METAMPWGGKKAKRQHRPMRRQNMTGQYLDGTATRPKILLTLRSLTLYIYGAPILDVSRSHTTTQHSR